SLGPLHPVIHPLVQDLGGHVHRMGVAGLIGKANVLGRVKSASSTERKLYEKADSVKGTQSGFERYREKPFNLHDAVGVEVTHEGSDTQDVIELADALKIHLIGKNVAGYEIIGFEAPSGEKYYKDYSAGKPDSGYRAIHLKALVQKTSNELPPLKAIEFHCTNDKWREENEFGRASHVVYKGQDNPQTVTEYVPEEELAKNLTVRVKIGRDKKTHKLDLLEGDHAHMILDALVSREIVSIPEALQGRTVLYEEYAPTEEQVRKGLRIPNPVSLRQIIDPTRTYHLIDLKNEGHLGSPEPLSFYDLNRLEAQVDERLWIQAIQEAKAKVTQAAKDKKRQEAESREDVKRRIASTDSTNRSIVMQRGLTSPERSGTDAETGSRFPRERFESRVEPPEKPTNTRHGKGRKKRT
ncbi:MAG TPA: hypothetical protein VI874_01240, partial [Candidatus Norongarragalinales archaeon]|nr:hypothetical protein [Candidatus Norongarragalinales archaeon]